MFTQRSKLVHAEIIELVQTDDTGRLNYVQLPKIRLFSLPISCQFDPFDKVVLPVLIYDREIWEYENLQVV